MKMSDLDLQKFCHRLPKVELHAHLNTTYSLQTLRLLLKSNNGSENIEDMYFTTSHPIAESFKLFTKIQSLVTTPEDVYILTKSIIEEYAQENVKYLELRSTPKHIPSSGMTKEVYLRTMIEAIKDSESEGYPIIVRILVSIDRRQGLENARVAVDLAEKLMNEDNIVVGIDFSGDPEVGDAADYIPVFLDAAKRKLKLALHLAELNKEHSFQETVKVLEQCCDLPIRIGHGTFLHHAQQNSKWSALAKFVYTKKIPIETCITSNLKTETVNCLEQHHFKYWKDRGHPVILCADGKGVYNTSLSQEYFLAMSAFQLTQQELKDYVVGTLDSIFGSDEIKEELRTEFTTLMSTLPSV
ncbi:adenosine deaminase-like protein [Biomphalaria pfeifferi]|uniref:Adenosine deaminase-like protein n=1 Tax=Biomphalaria pfeifferi TaxID=112525 RepID=A0AAD8CCF6_BIOPF|nr:adenosine deaminase-like protein [Biomphalaria pfeifferi]